MFLSIPHHLKINPFFALNTSYIMNSNFTPDFKSFRLVKMYDNLIKLNGHVFLKIMLLTTEYEWNWSIPWSKPHIPNIKNFDLLVDVFHINSIYYILALRLS